MKDEDGDSVNRLGKQEIGLENIPREDKMGGGTGLMYKDKYYLSLLDNDRLITFEFAQWQIKIRQKIVGFLLFTGHHTLKAIHTQLSSL